MAKDTKLYDLLGVSKAYEIRCNQATVLTETGFHHMHRSRTQESI
jgi:hypothetical protein